MNSATPIRWAAVLVLALGSPNNGVAQAANAPVAPEIFVTPNFIDVDLVRVTESVGKETGRHFIVDPRVQALVTLRCSVPISVEAFYEVYLSLLQAHGFIAAKSGNVIHVGPDPNRSSLPAEKMMTSVIAVRKVNAVQLVPILRPLIPQLALLQAYPESNLLILSDRESNSKRMMRVIARIDEPVRSDPEVIALQTISAAEVVRVVTPLVQHEWAAGTGDALSVQLSVDQNSNSIILSGNPASRLRIKALIAHLDTPFEPGSKAMQPHVQSVKVMF